MMQAFSSHYLRLDRPETRLLRAFGMMERQSLLVGTERILVWNSSTASKAQLGIFAVFVGIQDASSSGNQYVTRSFGRPSSRWPIDP